MPVLDRKPIFDAVRQLRDGRAFTSAEVKILDAGINLAFGPEIAVAPPVAAAGAGLAPPASATGLGDPAAFFGALRAGNLLGPQLTPSEVEGCTAIVDACARASWGIAWTADALATAYLETAHAMQPVKEANWLSEEAAHRYFMRMYDITGQRPGKARELGNLDPGDGALYAGRGYPQLTGKANYQRANAALPLYGITGVDLVAKPDLAMRPDVAAVVMIDGMEKGWFTTKKLADYLPRKGPATRAQFKPARRVINGLDRADDVAGYAVEFQDALMHGAWR